MSPDSPDPGPGPGAGSSRRPGRVRLDRRTIAICVCIAAIAALGAALIASVVVSDGSRASSNRSGLTPTADPDSQAVLSTGVIRFDGTPTSLAAYAGAGTPAVVNFFSSTCVPCVTEMPAFERVHRSVAGVRLIGVDVQDQVEPARRLIQRTGVTYDTVRDTGGDLLRSAAAAGLPTTLLIDRKGHVVDAHTGALSEPDLRRLIDRKLR